MTARAGTRGPLWSAPGAGPPATTARGDAAMWMPPLEPEWAGKVEFWELLFGTWTAYAFLVWLWEKVLRTPLEEWRYAMITFLGAGAFWINHYYLKAPGWLWMINLYTVFFVYFWWRLAVRGRGNRSAAWKLGATLSSLLFTVAFIAFEQLARYGVEHWGMHEFCWMALSFLGFTWLIRWRGRSTVKAEPVVSSPYPQVPWKGAGGPG
jgi:hypothetical protein